MPADNPDKVFYCTQCHIETTLAKVCPKCHRKTTLRPRTHSIESPAGARRRPSSDQTPAVASALGGSRRWIWILGGAAATVVVIGLAWWGLSRGRRDKPHKATQKVTHSFGSNTADPSRVFGAPRPGARVAPPPPPRICGVAYGASIRHQFHRPPKSAKGKASKPGKAGMAGKAGMTGKPGPRKRPRPKPKGPEAEEHLHAFLIAQRRGRQIYVPLAFEIRLTMGGRKVTALRLDRKGGILPDRRTRRQRRLGYHDSLSPGLRVSDLIGRALADVAPDPAGGLKVTRRRLKNRLVSMFLQTGLGLATFLRPRPPKPGTRVFEDRRLPPGTVTRGLKTLVRRFRLEPKKSPGAAGKQITYRVDAPALSRRRAKSTTPVRGHVSWVPGEPLPRSAELVLEKLPPRKGGGTQTVTLKLDHLGKRCNDK